MSGILGREGESEEEQLCLHHLRLLRPSYGENVAHFGGGGGGGDDVVLGMWDI